MGAFTSKVGVAKKGGRSLRTTIPEAVAELMKIALGDELEWVVKNLDSQGYPGGSEPPIEQVTVIRKVIYRIGKEVVSKRHFEAQDGH